MGSEPTIVLYDACVLYPFHLRNVLVQCAVDRLIQARWTDDIHDEWIRNLIAKTPGLVRQRLLATRDLMKRLLPEADVGDYHDLIPMLDLQDPNDRHVLAAAIRAEAGIIVSNDRGFTDRVLQPYGIRLRRPDAFLLDLYHADPELMLASLSNAKRNLSRSLPTSREFLDGLRVSGALTLFCAALERHLDDI